ncbi:uncharacterized [Tachysurus ichikawai]
MVLIYWGPVQDYSTGKTPVQNTKPHRLKRAGEIGKHVGLQERLVIPQDMRKRRFQNSSVFLVLLHALEPCLVSSSLMEEGNRPEGDVWDWATAELEAAVSNAHL